MNEDNKKVNTKKLLQISAVVGYGSTGKIVESIGQTAMQNGYESYVACGRTAYPSQSNLIHIGSKWNVYRHFIKSRLFDAHGLGSHTATKRLLKAIEELNPDIIHLHNIHGYYVNIIDLFSFLKESGKPIVWTFHDLWPVTGHCAHFTSAKCTKWKEKCYSCPIIQSYPKASIDRSTRNYQLKKRLFTSIENLEIIAVSNWLADTLRQSFLGDKKITVIYNGIDTDIFHPVKKDYSELKRKYNITTEKNLLGVATDWSEKKGLGRFNGLRKILPKDIGIILVGMDENQIAALPEGIIGIRRTANQEELAEFYSMADIVMNLSEEETFGLTTAEGFACGTPGIVMETTASPELVTPSTGLVANHDDIEAIRNAVEEILSKGKPAFSEACRKRAVEQYNQDNQWRKYIEVYRKSDF